MRQNLPGSGSRSRRPTPSAFVLDAGALVAVDRNDRAVLARLFVATRQGISLKTTGIIIAQVWRDASGRQANLAHFLRGVHVLPVDDRLGREAGQLLGKASRGDSADATVVVISAPGDAIFTSDVEDVTALVKASGRAISVVRF